MTVTEVAAQTAAPLPLDERISHRGPMRRWLISPEIGALIGAFVVWTFLWGNGDTFGTAGTTLNWLDVAAPYGIMATAIALLMIGGEFDLSSGVITGGTAMIIGLMSRFFMGHGTHIGWAILAAFAAAAAIGWFNGYMVNRTGLPSFIITLASFFVIRGLMLVLSKRLAQKVYVDQIKDQRGAHTFHQWIAHEWLLKEFNGRDTLYVVCVLVGVGLFIWGIIDQSLIRRIGVNLTGVVILVVGLAVGLVGFIGLNNTDGIGNNVLYGTLSAVGAVVAILGIALTRWTRRVGAKVGEALGTLPRDAMLRCGLGIIGVALACLIHVPFDRHERRAVMTWTSPGLRPVIAVIAALIGFVLAARSLLPGLRERVRAADTVKLIFFSAYAALVLMALTVAVLQLTTVQALRAMGMLLLATGGVAMMLNARGLAAKTSKVWQLIIGALAAAAVVVIALVARADATAVRFRTVLPTALIIVATLLLANTLVEYVMEKRTYGDAIADRAAKRFQLAGALIAFVGIAIRLLFTNFTAAHEAALRAAGTPVPQNVLRETVMWWLIVAGIGAYVLAKTRWGNWIFAVGGNKEAARAVGVPADRVKIGLFVTVSLCGALAGTLIALRYGTVQANQGTGLEFEFIIAAVVGGCLMTGGYGSVIGATLGAAILAMSTTGFQTVRGWNEDARFAFLGGVLLVAVLLNNYTRKKAQEAR
jgi:ribose/xylose/arabinose/galactoside ABC-type transport system permease subunit